MKEMATDGDDVKADENDVGESEQANDGNLHAKNQNEVYVPDLLDNKDLPVISEKPSMKEIATDDTKWDDSADVTKYEIKNQVFYEGDMSNLMDPTMKINGHIVNSYIQLHLKENKRMSFLDSNFFSKLKKKVILLSEVGFEPTPPFGDQKA